MERRDANPSALSEYLKFSRGNRCLSCDRTYPPSVAPTDCMERGHELVDFYADGWMPAQLPEH